jgi:hypothetical protein
MPAAALVWPAMDLNEVMPQDLPEYLSLLREGVYHCCDRTELGLVADLRQCK